MNATNYTQPPVLQLDTTAKFWAVLEALQQYIDNSHDAEYLIDNGSPDEFYRKVAAAEEFRDQLDAVRWQVPECLDTRTNTQKGDDCYLRIGAGRGAHWHKHSEVSTTQNEATSRLVESLRRQSDALLALAAKLESENSPST